MKKIRILVLMMIIILPTVVSCGKSIEQLPERLPEQPPTQSSGQQEDETIVDTLTEEPEILLPESVPNFSEDLSFIETCFAYTGVREAKLYIPYDEPLKTELIEDYLKEQGITEYMVGRDYSNSKGEPLAQYYVTADNRLCLILHLWGDYRDWEKGTIAYTNAISCVTLSLNGFARTGYIIHDFDNEHNIARENLYDPQDRLIASVMYENIAKIPFPVLTDFWSAEDTDFSFVSKVLCRNQKMWFSKEQMEFDEAGRFVSHNGIKEKEFQEFFTYPGMCFYDKSDRLVAIWEKPALNDPKKKAEPVRETEDYSGYIKLTYDKNVQLSEVIYRHKSFDDKLDDDRGGKIYCNDKGRMIYNDYYTQYGDYTDIFLYHEDLNLPWVSLSWCSQAEDFEWVYLFEKGDVEIFDTFNKENDYGEDHIIYQAVEDTLNIVVNYEPDVELFKQLLTSKGLIDMTTTFWGGDNKIQYVDKNNAQEYLYWGYATVSRSYGYGYGDTFTFDGNVRELPIRRSDRLSSINFDFDWNMGTEPEDSDERDKKLAALINAILKDYDTRKEQIFVLADGVIVFYDSLLTNRADEQAVGAEDVGMGTWIVWQKISDEYQLRMIFTC